MTQSSRLASWEVVRVLVCGYVSQTTGPSLEAQEQPFHYVVYLHTLDLSVIICELLLTLYLNLEICTKPPLLAFTKVLTIYQIHHT
jgi:hypothetical protein